MSSSSFSGKKIPWVFLKQSQPYSWRDSRTWHQLEMESGRPLPFSFSLADPELPIGTPDFSLEDTTVPSLMLHCFIVISMSPKVMHIKICKHFSY